MTDFKIGDRVAMRASWLKNTGQHTGPPAPTSIGPFARGELIEIDTSTTFNGSHLASVRWDDGHESRAITANLAHADRPNLRLSDPSYQGD